MAENIPFAIQKTAEEIEAMTPAERREYETGQARIVFGFDHRKTRRGEPIEQGYGAPGRETENHFSAIRKYEGPEAEKAAREAAKGRKTQKVA